MATPAAGVVVLIRFPFSDLQNAKLRPAIVLAHAGRGVGRLFERPTSRGAHFEDRHALWTAAVGTALRRDLRDAGVLNAKLFAPQFALFVEPIVLHRKAHRALMLSAAQARAYTMA